jgi:CMP-N-acetylneuraminic acid synthetase
MSGERIYPFFMEAGDFFDIDTEEDWAKAEAAIRQKPQ